MSRHWISSWSTIESTQPPQDTSARQTLIPFSSPELLLRGTVSQLCYRPVVTYCMVYYYTKRATLARLLANEGPAIYVVHLNKYFVISP